MNQSEIQYKTIEEIMSEYDKKDTKIPDYHIISSALHQYTTDEENKRPEWAYEVTACRLIDDPTGKSVWKGEYFTPLIHAYINGVDTEDPEHASITSDAVSYWNSRIAATENAMMRARYAGLVWEYGTLAGIPRTGDLLKTYVEALIMMADDETCDDVWIAQRYLRRAMQLSITMPELSLKVKKAFELVNSRSKDSQPGIWGVYFSMLAECPKAFSKEEINALLEEGEKRLARLAVKSASNEDGVNPDIVKQLAEILAKCYANNKKLEDRDRVLAIAETAHRHHFGGMSASMRFYMLQGIKAMYNAFGNSDHDEALIIEMQQEGKGMIAEMQQHEFAIEIPNEQWEDLKRQMTEGDEELQRAMFVYQFIPKKDLLDSQMKAEAAQYPLLNLTQNQFMTSSGLPLSVVGGVEDDHEGRLIHYVAQHISFESITLHQIIELHQASGVLSDDYIIRPSNPQPIGFSGILLAKRQNSFYCTYFLHNRNVADTKSPYPIKRLEVIRWFNQKSMVFNQSLS